MSFSGTSLRPYTGVLWLSMLCAGQLAAQGTTVALVTGPEHLLTNEGIRHERALGDVVLAPDGEHAVARITDSTADGGKSHLWLLDLHGGVPRQLTYSPESDKRGERGPEWMPDGASVLFLAKRGEHTSLYRLPMGGGEAKAFDLKVVPPVDESRRVGALPPPSLETKAEDDTKPVPVDVSSYRIAPDGREIAVIVHDPDTTGEKKQKDARADANWVDHDLHRDRLYLLEVSTEKLTPVPLEGNVQGASWSPDSERLVAVTEDPNGAAELGPANRAWEVRRGDPAHPNPMTALPRTVGPVAFARDGATIYFLAQAQQDAPPGVLDLYQYSPATGQVEDLSAHLDGSLSGNEPLPLLRGGVLETAEQGLTEGLLHFEAKGGSPAGVSTPFAALNRVATNQAQTGWLIAGSRGGEAPALTFTAQLGQPGQAVKLPEMTPAGAGSVSPKRLVWTSDHLRIEGLLYLPKAASSGSKVPLVVEVHGGPTGAYVDSYCSFCDFLVGHGWAVLRTNPRGSTGRGTAFAAANHNDLGGGDLRDILAGVDFVLRTEPVDSNRIALMGYSYGGEMAGFMETRTTRFKAIVSMAPVIDQHSEYGTERGSWYDQWFYGKPWEHPEDAWRQSPLSGAARARTPFLLLQGEADTTDPLGQSQEMYRALRQMRVPVEMVTYPRVDHGPLGQAIYGVPTTEPWHGFDARQRIVTFLNRFLSSSTVGEE